MADNLIDRVNKAQGLAPAEPQATETDNREATEKAAAPQTEGDKITEPAAQPLSNEEMSALYKIKIGDQERELTDAQIAGTFERYRDLNFKHSNMKPVIDTVSQLMERTGIDADAMNNEIIAALKAKQHNPTMGQQSNAPNTTQQGDKGEAPNDLLSGDMLSQYEEQNAVQLPPGYRELLAGRDATSQQLQQMQMMMQQLLAQSQGVADAARQAGQQQAVDRGQLMQQRISSNIDQAAQRHLGTTGTDSANDFLAFIYERGYTTDDFVDPALADRAMADFANLRNQPEMERLRQAAQRRQAFSFNGTMGNTAGQGAAAAAAPTEAATPFDQMADAAMTKRFG